MEYRRFGPTDMAVSALGFGCWEMGGTHGDIAEAEGAAAINRAIYLGINCFDTATRQGKRILPVIPAEAGIQTPRRMSRGLVSHCIRRVFPFLHPISGDDVELSGTLFSGHGNWFHFAKLGLIYYELDSSATWDSCVSGR